MEFLGLDHNSQEEIYNKFTNSSDKENYAFATHNRELLINTQKSHKIKIIGEIPIKEMKVVYENKDIDIMKDVIKNYYQFVNDTFYNQLREDIRLFLTKNELLFLTKDDLLFKNKIIKSYNQFDSKIYIVIKRFFGEMESYYFKLLVFYNKNVDIFTYDIDSNSLILTEINFENYIKSLNLSKMLVKTETGQSYLLNLVYMSYNSLSRTISDVTGITHFLKQSNDDKNVRIFRLNGKIVKIIDKNYKIIRFEGRMQMTDIVYKFYDFIDEFYNPKKDHKILLEIFNLFTLDYYLKRISIFENYDMFSKFHKLMNLYITS
jgi:hypothetical protein